MNSLLDPQNLYMKVKKTKRDFLPQQAHESFNPELDPNL